MVVPLLLVGRDEELLTPRVPLSLMVRGAVELMVVPLRVLESSPLVVGLLSEEPLSVVVPLWMLPEPGRTDGRTDDEVVVVVLVPVAICVPPRPPRRSL